MRRIILGPLAGLVLLFGACGDDSKPPPATCSSLTCIGCCDNGKCLTGATMTALKCGQSGGSCKACGTGETCQLGACTANPLQCGPATCSTGCCLGTQCMPGEAPSACGKGGGTCNTCTGDQQCGATGTCAVKPCDAVSCATGCCYNGACMPGNHPALCGKLGATCAACKNGEQCTNNACVAVSCGTATCPQGCCDKNGNCVPGTNETICGKGGAACTACGTNQTCKNQICENTTTTCNATSCTSGCCDSTGACAPGNANNACGSKGAACTQCGSTQACTAQKCTCTATSCPTGCCEGDVCKPGNVEASCGAGGIVCKQCKTGEKCGAGQCSTACNFATCATGCCDPTTGCQPGNDPAGCGLNGVACAKCLTGEQCVTGTCNNPTTCSKTSCASGCCKGGQCQAGTSDLGCGGVGNVCVPCAPFASCDATKKTCMPKPTGKWTVTIVSAKIDPSKSWDSIGDKPDCYVEITVGAQKKTTKSIGDDYNPVWNETVLTATASELEGTIKIKVLDSDFLGSDTIADWVETVYWDELMAGTLTLSYPASGNTDLIEIKFAFAPVP